MSSASVLQECTPGVQCHVESTTSHLATVKKPEIKTASSPYSNPIQVNINL